MKYNVNASLIHEARMILTHILRSQETISFFDQKFKGKKAAASKTPPVAAMTCCFCITLESHESPAITTIGGYSVCRKHAQYVRDENFLSITTQIIRDKHKPA